MPRSVPRISGPTVSSGSTTEAGMNGRNAAAWGSSGCAPTMSGYSCGGTSEIAMPGPFLAKSLGPYPNTPLAGPGFHGGKAARTGPPVSPGEGREEGGRGRPLGRSGVDSRPGRASRAPPALARSEEPEKR